MLLDFAVEGYVGEATKAVEEELARTEAALTIEVGGERLGFREAPVAQANEPDAERRAEIEARGARGHHVRTSGPIHQQLIEAQHACARELGWTSYADMCAHCKGIDLNGLSEQTAAFSAASADELPADARARSSAGRSGSASSELRRADLPRFFRVVEYDRHFPRAEVDRELRRHDARASGSTCPRRPGVTFDIGSRPNKAPRAFCAPVRVPGEVYLVVAPVGGWDDYVTLFHEGGHTEHCANVDRALPFEFRHLGDNSVTETYAFLIQHLVEDPSGCRAGSGSTMPPSWSRTRRPSDSSTAPLHRQDRVRARAARRGQQCVDAPAAATGSNGRWDALATRYAQLLGAAVKIKWPTRDVPRRRRSGLLLRLLPAGVGARDPPALRTCANASAPRGSSTPEAGEVLRGLWRDGQRLDAEELLGELTGARLDFGAVLDRPRTERLGCATR